MSMGLPVISTRVGGIAEMVEEGKGAALIEPGDLAALKREILRLAASQDLRLAMGQNNWQRIQSCFSPSFVSQLIDQIYARLLNELPATRAASSASSG
jgi:glycosyltransferase involved in cell wall biosynthesis